MNREQRPRRLRGPGRHRPASPATIEQRAQARQPQHRRSGAIGNTAATTQTPFSQSTSALIDRDQQRRDPEPHAHLHLERQRAQQLVRGRGADGRTNGATSGCEACSYPGSPSRTQSSDGHFVTVTFTNLCGDGVDTRRRHRITGEQCDQGGAQRHRRLVLHVDVSVPRGGAGCRASNGDVRSSGDLYRHRPAACPADAKCRTARRAARSAGIWTSTENCTGSAATCPADAFELERDACRASAGVCDLPRTAPGRPTCPARRR